MLLFAHLIWVIYPALCLAAVAATGLTAEQLKHLKDDPKATHLVVFEIGSISSDKIELAGTLELALFGEKLPITVGNFVEKSASLINGYQNSIFHRVVKDFMVQGGNLMRTKDGYRPIEFNLFDDEGFPVKHNKVGRLSMANSGPHTNGCQFFITTEKFFPHLDSIHVVFGQVVLGFDTLDKMNQVETLDSKPIHDLIITKVAVTKLGAGTSHKEVEIEDNNASAGYLHLVFVCVVLVLIYAFYWRKGRKTLVDLTEFKM